MISPQLHPAPGSGYVVGDVLDVLARGPGAPPVDPLGAVILITSVSAGGVVSEFRIIDGGSGYTATAPGSSIKLPHRTIT